MVSICYVGVATEATEPPHAPRNTSRASATTTRLYPVDQRPSPHVSNYLSAAGEHALPSPASSSATPTYGARAGRAPLADRKLALSHTQWSPPSTSTTQPSAQGPCRLGRAQQPAKKPLLGHPALHLCPGSAPTIRYLAPRNPPTSSTCITATKSSLSKLPVTAPCAGMLRTVPHHLQPPCCPYRCRNRKPFRAAGRAGRPARAGEERNGAGPQSPQIVLRTEEACVLVTTTTSAQAQPSTELKGTGGKQQYGAG